MEQREPSNLLEWPSRDRGRQKSSAAYRRDIVSKIRISEDNTKQKNSFFTQSRNKYALIDHKNFY